VDNGFSKAPGEVAVGEGDSAADDEQEDDGSAGDDDEQEQSQDQRCEENAFQHNSLIRACKLPVNPSKSFGAAAAFSAAAENPSTLSLWSKQYLLCCCDSHSLHRLAAVPFIARAALVQAHICFHSSVQCNFHDLKQE
jgi:hypothetical protein